MDQGDGRQGKLNCGLELDWERADARGPAVDLPASRPTEPRAVPLYRQQAAPNKTGAPVWVIVLVLAIGGAVFAGIRHLRQGVSPNDAAPAVLDASAAPGSIDAEAIELARAPDAQEARAFVDSADAAFGEWSLVGNPRWFIEGAYERGALNVYATEIEHAGNRRVAGSIVVQMAASEIDRTLLEAWFLESTRDGMSLGDRWAILDYE